MVERPNSSPDGEANNLGHGTDAAMPTRVLHPGGRRSVSLPSGSFFYTANPVVDRQDRRLTSVYGKPRKQSMSTALPLRVSHMRAHNENRVFEKSGHEIITGFPIGLCLQAVQSVHRTVFELHPPRQITGAPFPQNIGHSPHRTESSGETGQSG